MVFLFMCLFYPRLSSGSTNLASQVVFSQKASNRADEFPGAALRVFPPIERAVADTDRMSHLLLAPSQLAPGRRPHMNMAQPFCSIHSLLSHCRLSVA